jgi:hypothetical protein
MIATCFTVIIYKGDLYNMYKNRKMVEVAGFSKITAVISQVL